MARDLERNLTMGKAIRVTPCDSQRQTLEAMGFEYDPESEDFPEVQWTGHGLCLHIGEQDGLTQVEAVRFIVETAMNKARLAIKDRFQLAFNEPFTVKKP